MLALGHLLHSQPDRDAAASTDELTADLLRMFGLSAKEAAKICSLPLPPVEELVGERSA